MVESMPLTNIEILIVMILLHWEKRAFILHVWVVYISLTLLTCDVQDQHRFAGVRKDSRVIKGD